MNNENNWRDLSLDLLKMLLINDSSEIRKYMFDKHKINICEIRECFANLSIDGVAFSISLNTFAFELPKRIDLLPIDVAKLISYEKSSSHKPKHFKIKDGLLFAQYIKEIDNIRRLYIISNGIQSEHYIHKIEPATCAYDYLTKENYLTRVKPVQKTEYESF